MLSCTRAALRGRAVAEEACKTALWSVPWQRNRISLSKTLRNDGWKGYGQTWDRSSLSLKGQQPAVSLCFQLSIMGYPEGRWKAPGLRTPCVAPKAVEMPHYHWSGSFRGRSEFLGRWRRKHKTSESSELHLAMQLPRSQQCGAGLQQARSTRALLGSGSRRITHDTLVEAIPIIRTPLPLPQPCGRFHAAFARAVSSEGEEAARGSKVEVSLVTRHRDGKREHAGAERLHPREEDGRGQGARQRCEDTDQQNEACALPLHEGIGVTIFAAHQIEQAPFELKQRVCVLASASLAVPISQMGKEAGEAEMAEWHLSHRESVHQHCKGARPLPPKQATQSCREPSTTSAQPSGEPMPTGFPGHARAQARSLTLPQAARSLVPTPETNLHARGNNTPFVRLI
ncbi:hypothetical protein Anapl_16524 [Anas platyrhynchos]|uniref:Uncharacterized protein n=1 Tax=Anas platyrhynchos TaxID=8839 RepID=R0KNX5_ANAPL|nr:hypothetical protein Anapl_16524 [Anas platyrhynchos]